MQKSWGRPEVDWISPPDVHAIVLPVETDGILRFIAEGTWEIRFSGQVKPVIDDILAMMGLRNSFREELQRVLKVFSDRQGRISEGDRMTLHFSGIVFLEDVDRLCILCSPLPGIHQATLMPGPFMNQVNDLWAGYSRTYQEWERSKEEKRRSCQEFADRLPEEGREKFLAMEGWGEEPRPKEPTISPLLKYVPPGAWLPSLPCAAGVREKIVRNTVECSKILPSRDGSYHAITCWGSDGKEGALVSWTPRGEMPTYREVRAAAMAVVPRGFRKPLRGDIAPPSFELDPTMELSLTGINDSVLDASESNSDMSDLNDRRLDRPEAEEGAAQAKKIINDHGFEAFGWYQGFHSWNEESWGIYLHAKRMDGLVVALHEDLCQSGNRSNALALLLGVGLVYKHELFHARVEACTTLLEVSSRRAHHLAYQKKVYDALRMTEAWLEEALANWTAHAWVKGKMSAWQHMGLVSDPAGVLKTVEDWLAFSPPGYSNWKAGDDLYTWRTFSSQLTTARPEGPRTVSELPLEGLFKGSLPFDYFDSDIPARFVGTGFAADAFFSSPSRREAQRLLRHYRYVPEKKRGKGSHEIWKGSDNRGIFSLPARDPLSVGVFTSLLHHFTLTKEAYLRDLRPNI